MVLEDLVVEVRVVVDRVADGDEIFGIIKI